jgi:hyperosmotically inducible periplasmic protein
MKPMKKTRTILLTFFSVLIFVLSSCSQENKDTTVKADLSTKAKTEKDFLGVRFVVENGLVTLNGNCPTDKARSHVESTVKAVYGVRGVINNITIAPVTLGTDELLKQGVDSVLQRYAGVQAIVRDSVVELEGSVDSKQSQKLLASIEKLRPERVENKLMIK